MPYKDPEKQAAAVRESKRRARARKAAMDSDRVLSEVGAGVERVLPEPPSRDELLKLLGVQARCGSVRAIELLLRMEDAAEEKPSDSIIDELAGRRNYASRSGA